MEPLRDGSYTIYKVISALYIIVGLALTVMFEFVIKLNYNVYKVNTYNNEKLSKFFYFIVYEPKNSNSFAFKKSTTKNQIETKTAA
jgi:hypothetical protein